MPVYLLHGFRWPREGLTGIRVRCVMQDLEDCSADYIQNDHSAAELLGSFRKEYPDIMQRLEGPGRGLTLLEQYDPNDTTSDHAVCQPYAYVGDKVVTIAAGPSTATIPGSLAPSPIPRDSLMPADHTSYTTVGQAVVGKAMSPAPRARDTPLSVNVEDVMSAGPGVTPQAWEALADLRDKIAEGEKIGWFVIYNGDPDRFYDEDEEYEDEDAESTEQLSNRLSQQSTKQKNSAMPSDEKEVSNALTTNRDGPPQATLPIRDKGDRVPGMTTTSLPPELSKPKPAPAAKAPKSPGFPRKLFGRKS